MPLVERPLTARLRRLIICAHLRRASKFVAAYKYGAQQPHAYVVPSQKTAVRIADCLRKAANDIENWLDDPRACQTPDGLEWRRPSACQHLPVRFRHAIDLALPVYETSTIFERGGPPPRDDVSGQEHERARSHTALIFIDEELDRFGFGLGVSYLLDCFQEELYTTTGDQLDPRWLTGTVVSLTQAIYERRKFEHLPILADALADAGCDNDDIICHCRRPGPHGGPHVLGCWVLDLLLGKS